MANPKTKRRRRSNGASRRAPRRPNPFTKTKSRRRRSNPFGFSRSRRSNRRRNPVITGYSVTDLAKIGISAAAGGYGTRALTQMLLSSNNTGWMGYLGNGAVAIVLGYLADKFLGKDYGVGVIAGGLSATAIRIWSEQVSQTSPSQMSGLGDMDFSRNGMGEYIQTGFPVPTISVKNAQGQYVVQAPPYNSPAALPAAATVAAAAKPNGGKSMGRIPVARFRSRFA